MTLPRTLCCALIALTMAGMTAGAAGASTPATQGADAADEWAYPIVKGDTLIAIAATHLLEPGRWRDLQKLNHVRNPRRLVPGSTLRIPLAWLKSEEGAAEIVYARGQVMVRAPGEAAPSPGRQGQRLPAGSLVETAADSSLALRLSDGSRLLVAPGSRATLDELREYRRAGLHRTQVDLQRGSLESQVTPSRSATVPYKVRTPVAILGVRGTDFRAHAADERTGVEVLSGAVGAVAGVEQRVEAGFGTYARAGAPVAPPRPLLAAPTMLPPAASPVDGRLEARWAAVPGAAAYRAQLFGDDASLLRDARFDGPAAAWSDVPVGRYRLRVRAIDGDGIEGLDAGTAVERVAAAAPAFPLPPYPGQPYAGSRIAGPDVTFAWTVRESGRRYRLQVAASADFASPVVDVADAAAAPLSVLQKRLSLHPGRWFWRVAALGDDGRPGPFAAAVPFEVVEPAR